MKIIRFEDLEFDSLWRFLRAEAIPRTALYTALDLEYLANYPQPCEAKDVSFLIEEGGNPLAGVLVAKKPMPTGDYELSTFGRPIWYLQRPLLAASQAAGIACLVKEELDRLRTAFPIRQITYQNPEGSLTVLAKYMLDEGARAFPAFAQVIDLKPEVSGLRQTVRKSYKSMINWGEKNLRPVILDHSNLNEEDFEEYRQLHFLAAGRETRCRKTWHINYEMIRAKEAFMVLGRLEGRLVSGALFNVCDDACYYSTAASDRALFEKPLGHCIIWRALLHAKELGCCTAELGQVLFPRQPVQDSKGADNNPADVVKLPDEKNLNISKFKRGFGGRTECRLDVIWKG